MSVQVWFSAANFDSDQAVEPGTTVQAEVWASADPPAKYAVIPGVKGPLVGFQWNFHVLPTAMVELSPAPVQVGILYQQVPEQPGDYYMRARVKSNNPGDNRILAEALTEFTVVAP